MNHLTDDQLSEWLAGEGTAETRWHLETALNAAMRPGPCAMESRATA